MAEPPDAVDGAITAVAKSVAVLDGALAFLLRTLPEGDTGAVATLRARLLGAGLSEDVAARCLRLLKILLSDENDSASERLGLTRDFECCLCGTVPDPRHIVFGERASVCRSCALLASGGAMRPGLPAETNGLACLFCGIPADAAPDVDKFPDRRQVGFVCVNCVRVALEVFP
ncbi:hypothetical protein [Microbispora siamensis]|uniref:ClpX-type ZB domain-containing protein n=1 Tax=Microbispora siamensis TaxID=564413 RepID=A0ABQ4GDD1_9ACTN|nr:hypothetical protein [Microbispora siamensis]GIH59442.1 hypothetical protein Msi02_02590 [Microbispora siamensis]